jgi:alkylation response protein AidB-like acyl-CoA dehydrogenase
MNDRTSDAALLSIAHAMANLDHPVKTEVADWARQELATGDRVGADLRSDFAADDWKRCADRGIHGVMVPTEFGGSGADLATTLLTLEGLGHGCRDNGLAYAICSQMLSTQETLVRFANDAQQREWIPRLITGDAIGAFAITEPDSGSDAYSLTTTALRRDDGSYVLNGHKAYITLASRCAFVIVFASTKPGAGAWGLSAFLVRADLDGVERLANRDKMGMRTTPFGDITLTDVVVPASAMIGREGAGAAIFNAVLQVERSFVFATQVGAMQRQLEATIAYASERRQGGQAIGNYQAVAHRIADMKQRHETARLMLYRAAMASVTGRGFAMSAALAKLTASEAGLDAALSASMVHGAKGYVSEFEVERDLRDAIGGLVYSGTSDIQRNIIARLLGLG